MFTQHACMHMHMLTSLSDLLPLVWSSLVSFRCAVSFSGGIDPRPAVFGVVRRLGDKDGDDDEAHSNQQVRGYEPEGWKYD